MPHKRITLTIEEELLVEARKRVGLIPLSRWIENLVRQALADDA